MAQQEYIEELLNLEERKEREIEKQVCEICQEQLFGDEAPSAPFAINNCSDVYHEACLKPWLQTCIEN